jgi:hypothetical protein
VDQRPGDAERYTCPCRNSVLQFSVNVVTELVSNLEVLCVTVRVFSDSADDMWSRVFR